MPTSATTFASPPTQAAAARILLVDDSAVVRSVFERIFASDPAVDLVETVTDSADAIVYLRQNKVDMVLLDIELPGRSGLDALPDILVAAAPAPVMIVSARAERNGPAAIRALELGACDTLSKPGTGAVPGQFAQTLLSKVKRLAQQRMAQQSLAQQRAAPIEIEIPAASSRNLAGPPGCIAIGASTGGIAALSAFLGELSPRIDCPIFITQHLPAEFIPFLVRQLAQRCARTVCIPEENMIPRRNHVYIAPGHAHLRCRSTTAGPRITLSREVVPMRYWPAVDPQFEGVAECFGDRAVAVVLSGMGNDGLLGAHAIVAQGGLVYAQDMASSVVWGMPGAVARDGLASGIATPERLAHFINASLPA